MLQYESAFRLCHYYGDLDRYLDTAQDEGKTLRGSVEVSTQPYGWFVRTTFWNPANPSKDSCSAAISSRFDPAASDRDTPPSQWGLLYAGGSFSLHSSMVACDRAFENKSHETVQLEPRRCWVGALDRVRLNQPSGAPLVLGPVAKHVAREGLELVSVNSTPAQKAYGDDRELWKMLIGRRHGEVVCTLLLSRQPNFPGHKLKIHPVAHRSPLPLRASLLDLDATITWSKGSVGEDFCLDAHRNSWAVSGLWVAPKLRREGLAKLLLAAAQVVVEPTEQTICSNRNFRTEKASMLWKNPSYQKGCFDYMADSRSIG